MSLATIETRKQETFDLQIRSVRQLMDEFPYLRQPIIHNLLRDGETMNVIAASKVGKSWLTLDLALAVATGRPWLDTYPTERGGVLIIDNELHRETSANRIPRVMDSRKIKIEELGDNLFVANVRGRLKDIHGLAKYFEGITPGQYRLIIIDAFYRVMPNGCDENDNGAMARIYNLLDQHAAKLRCAFVLVHHSTKGSQSSKAVTDVGAGAGSQSRATDTHLILRPHEQNDVVVLDAAVRSWPPIEPRCLRWAYPVWTPEDSLDPADLRPERPKRKQKPGPATLEEKPVAPTWDVERFVGDFLSTTPQPTMAIIQAAVEAGLSERKATRLLKLAETEGKVHRWRFGSTQPVQFATIAQESNGPTV